MPSIAYSEDLKRISALPRRQATYDFAVSLVPEWTRLLTTPLGKKEGWELQAWQAFALYELDLYRKGYWVLPVGTGKTLLAWLAAYVLGAKNPVFMTSAGLVEDTITEWEKYARYWESPRPAPRIVDFREMSLEENVDKLLTLKPDLLVIDESDMMSKQEASVPKRIGRCVDAHNPIVVTMTGTAGRWNPKDFSHMLLWSHKDKAPWPRDKEEGECWNLALSGKAGLERPLGMGELTSMIPDLDRYLPEDEELHTEYIKGQTAFRVRLSETPGVIIVDEDSCDQPLTINLVKAPEDPELDKYFHVLRNYGVDPDGDLVSDPLSMMRFDSWIGNGITFYYDPEPPSVWRDAKKAWSKLCQSAIKKSEGWRKPLDTEEAVRRSRYYRDNPIVDEWFNVQRPSIKLKSKPRFLSASTINYCAQWSRKNVGLIAVETIAMAEAISDAAQIPYYGAEGVCRATGVNIRRADVSKPAVISIAANKRGKNLQGWNKMLIVDVPQSARYLEQLLGREHRQGQLKPVCVDILIKSIMTLDMFDSAVREAKHVRLQQLTTQKILRAETNRSTFTIPAGPDVSWRWRRPPPREE
jgi:hypothetical protein